MYTCVWSVGRLLPPRRALSCRYFMWTSLIADHGGRGCCFSGAPAALTAPRGSDLRNRRSRQLRFLFFRECNKSHASLSLRAATRSRRGNTHDRVVVGASLPPPQQEEIWPMNSRGSGRTYRGIFGSRTPQRPEPGPAFAVSPTSAKFQRSNAQIIGPGSYYPLPASACQDFSSERPLSSFASTIYQRGV